VIRNAAGTAGGCWVWCTGAAPVPGLPTHWGGLRQVHTKSAVTLLSLSMTTAHVGELPAHAPPQTNLAMPVGSVLEMCAVRLAVSSRL
jgi:hypothetical protein